MSLPTRPRFRHPGQTARVAVGVLALWAAAPASGQALDQCDSLELSATQRLESDRLARYRQALEKGRYQEVAWALNDIGEHEQSQAVARCLEQILREGEVLSVQPMGGGISTSLKAELTRGVSAVFKTTNSFDGCFRHEVAAYRMDRRLDFQTVPLTVLRTIDTQIGSLQYFVNDATPAHLTEGARRTTALRILDFLIDNEDRHGKNWLYYRFDGRLRQVAIDHNLTFGCRREARLLSRDIRAVPPDEAARMRDRLEALGDDEIESLLTDLVVGRRALRRVERARDKLIGRLNRIVDGD